MKKINTDIFIDKAKKIHGEKYNYSKVNFKRCDEKVCIICPKHGEFFQMPYSHLSGKGCRKCQYEKISSEKNIGTDLFVSKSKEIYGNKYDYSKVNYKRCDEKVCIVCPKHGEFWQTPANHLSNHGCPKCGKIEKAIKKKKTTDKFIHDAKKIHGDKYDYSKVEYKGVFEPIEIICKKHGEFTQRPNDHLNGHGCPTCCNSILEKMVEDELNKNSIKFDKYHRFDWLINEETNYPYSIDFYLPEYNIAIECQGEQHFKPIKFFGGELNFYRGVKRDVDKKRLCRENNVKLIYFLDSKYNIFLEKSKENIFFNNTKNLIEYILNYG